MDILSVFQGISTPLPDLISQVQNMGWELTNLNFEDGQYVAQGRNVHGEIVAKYGPNEETAVSNLLIAVARRNHIRSHAMWKVGMWDTSWTDKLNDIAEAYADAPIYDPKAVAAYKVLGDDSLHRLEVLKNHLNIIPTNDPNPYKSANDMRKDVHKKKQYQMSVYGMMHPVWTQEQAAAFRAVHDILGHGVAGGDYGWHGQNRAMAAHAPLLDPTSQQALFSEAVARPAYMQVYGQGPHKIALFPDYIDGPIKTENPAGHSGVHPSQVIVPGTLPSVHGATGFQDVNAEWSSGVDPLYQNAYLHHGDPLEGQAVMNNAKLIDTGWSNFKGGSGQEDRARMKQAIVNAFRVALLSPRKDFRWNAIHYQHIKDIPGDVDDPKIYWDKLESERRQWNAAQGISPDAHMPYFQFVKPFETIIFAQHPEKGWEAAKEIAERTLFHWWTEEQEHIAEEDAKKPAEKQRSADEIERRANEALGRRLKQFIKPHDDRTDNEDLDQMSMFGKLAVDQYNLLTGLPSSKYGAFMGTHLKAISQISQHADEILDAALEDVKNHDGTGHHFRQIVLSLNISGAGPKVCSFAWLLLQPMTSQLATMDTHMIDILGRDYEKEMNNRDYFKFERELAAGRDASGYSHIPLGAFQWGMWDAKRNGLGVHQDHSAIRVLDPIPHQQVDFNSKVQNLKGDSWLKQAPDWWQNTGPARQQVADEWDNTYGKDFPQQSIPYQGVPATIAKTAYAESFDYWWDKENPIGYDIDAKARSLAEYAAAAKKTKSEMEDWLDEHKKETHLSDSNFKRFQSKFFSKFDRINKKGATATTPFYKSEGQEVRGLPGQSLMHHLVTTTGLDPREIWNLYPDEMVGKL